MKMYRYYKKEKVRNLDFQISDLINAVKMGFNDGHICLQTNIFEFNTFNKKINIIRQEDNNFNDICKEILGVELPKRNCSKTPHRLDLNSEDKLFLYNKYKADFDAYTED
jgi:hypothetical protein